MKKQKIILTRGLPASGKSTWSKEQVAKSNGKVKRVNKDDLRDMIDAGIWSKINEQLILDARDAMLLLTCGLLVALKPSLLMTPTLKTSTLNA
jgi:tRNA uridine 5-carbamoylmethylation protein Kti12